jgi:hypothetical protein
MLEELLAGRKNPHEVEINASKPAAKSVGKDVPKAMLAGDDINRFLSVT